MQGRLSLGPFNLLSNSCHNSMVQCKNGQCLMITSVAIICDVFSVRKLSELGMEMQ